MGDTRKEQERTELHRVIWNIANDLRGSVDGWDFKQYVLGMLFYRYISENLSSYLNANAGIDSVIAIAHGLGLPREIVFRARGWLTSDTPAPDYVPDADMLTLLQDVDRLPLPYALPRIVAGRTRFWRRAGRVTVFCR
jgi:hypothetical protein